MKKRFTEEQIAYALKRHETGIATKDICREMGVAVSRESKVGVQVMFVHY